MSSTFHIDLNMNVQFKNNSADFKGGAIYVEPVIPSDGTECLLHLQDPYFKCLLSHHYGSLSLADNQLSNEFREAQPCNTNTLFDNNKANIAGDNVYGASLQGRCLHYIHSVYEKCQLVVNGVEVSQSGNSSVSSDPQRVCLCDKGKRL